MIYTITANPSLDYIMRIKHFEEGETNRADTTELYAGGKGINVSTILSRLGQPNTALGFLAGFSGRHLCDLLADREFGKDFIWCRGYTRINVKLKSAVESEINGTGLELKQDDVDQMIDKVKAMTSEDVLILSGSLPGQLDTTFYRTLIETAPKDMLCVVDATGMLLEETLPLHPFLIKPNQDELEALFGKSLSDLKDLAQAAQKLQKMGARNVLVSRGKDGAMLAGMDGNIYLATCPQGKLVNSVGSGDSMVAGFVSGWLDTQNLAEALRLGIYCGSATAFTEDLAIRQDIDRLEKESPIELHQVSF